MLLEDEEENEHNIAWRRIERRARKNPQSSTPVSGKKERKGEKHIFLDVIKSDLCSFKSFQRLKLGKERESRNDFLMLSEKKRGKFPCKLLNFFYFFIAAPGISAPRERPGAITSDLQVE